MKKLEAKYDGKILGLGEIMLRLTPPNYEKIIQIDNMAEILYRTDEYGKEFCPIDKKCPHGDFEAEKEDCLKCIKAWLKSEVSE